MLGLGLVVTEGSTVEVAHEALIRGWPQLRQWIDEDRGALLVHRRLTEAAAEWQRLEWDESALYRGLRLDLALAWRKGHEQDLNEGERDFLDASLDLRQRREAEQRRMAEEKEAQRRRELRQQRLIAQLSVAGLLVALLLALAAGYQWKTAAEQRRVALSEKLAIAAKEAANDNKFDLALLLGAEANEIGHFPEAEAALLTLLLKRNGFMGFLQGHADAVWGLAFSPDGRTLASAGRSGKIWLWDVNIARPRGEPLSGYQDVAWGMAYSPDGKTLALGGEDGTTRLWDIQTRQPLGEPLTGHQDAVWSIAFSPDGRTLASGGADRTLRLWDVATEQLLGAPLVGHQDDVTSIAFSPDGTMLASGSKDRTVRLWDIERLQPLEEPLQLACALAGRNLTPAEWRHYLGNEKYRKTCPEWPGPLDAETGW